jgi:hypothetical protein
MEPINTNLFSINKLPSRALYIINNPVVHTAAPHGCGSSILFTRISQVKASAAFPVHYLHHAILCLLKLLRQERSVYSNVAAYNQLQRSFLCNETK